MPKFYSVFSYDNVLNYSAPVTVRFSIEEVIPVVDDEWVETQEEEEKRLQLAIPRAHSKSK